jgi:hypothetical protein
MFVFVGCILRVSYLLHFSILLSFCLCNVHSLWAFCLCAIKTINATYWLVEIFMGNQVFSMVHGEYRDKWITKRYVVLKLPPSIFLFAFWMRVHNANWLPILKKMCEVATFFVFVIQFSFSSFAPLFLLWQNNMKVVVLGEDNGFQDMRWLLIGDNVFNLWYWSLLFCSVSLFHFFCTLLEVLLEGAFRKQQGWGK